MKLKFDYFTKCLLLLLVAVGMSSFAMAQRTIRGTVTDAQTGDPLIGANILVIGTSSGTITDIDGTYELQVPEGATAIEFTYTGYAAQRVTLGTGNVYDVALSAGSVLDEIVVVGYGTARRSDLTGSVVSVGEDDFNKGLIATPDQLLQGRAAGVQILNNSGQPGGASTIRIRGNSSVRAGNQPLFVVDGVQLTGASSKPGTGNGFSGNAVPSNPLNYLNPADIESIQVLKDASATAIYGSRGANGVIIITTKKGKSGAPSIEFGTSLGFSSILRSYDVLDGNEYRAALSEYGLTSGDYGDNVNAMDELMRTGLVNNHNISISGGGGAGTYRVSLGYFDQEGIVKNNDLNRLTANISGSYKFFESQRFGVDFNLIASRTKENGPAVSTDAGFEGSLIGNALQWNPTHPLYEADGSPVIIPAFGNTSLNPLAVIEAYKDRTNTTDYIFSISPSYKITDNLIYKFNYNISDGVGSRRSYTAAWLNLNNIQDRGRAAFDERAITNQILTHTLNFDKRLTSDLSFNGLVGYEYQKRTEKGAGMVAQDFIVDDFDYTNIFGNSTQNSRSVYSYSPPDQELQSFLARANFNYADKYLLTASFRADGSSKFGENNRYGYFPAFAFAWNLHNEGFLSDGPFDNLKLRLGWGKTGNSEFDAGASQERWGFGQQSIALENVANPDLKWETTTNINAGIDFALFDYKLTGTIEYFNRTSEDLLFTFPAIPPAPASNYWINLDGQNVNKGVEIAMNAQLLDKEDLKWDLGFNAAFISNELKDYTGPNILYGQLFGQGNTGAISMRLESGQPLNSFYLQEFDRIGEDGQSVYLNDGEKAFVGDPNPDVLLGISTGLSFGKFNLGMNFNGAFGHVIFNNTKMSVLPISNLGTRNIDATLLEGSVQEATSNPIAPSSRFLEKGDYLKLANATLTYNLGNIGNSVKNVRLYLSGTNLLVFTGYDGFDPEVNTENVFNGLPSFGIEYIPYPSARTIVVGANFSF